MRKTKARLFATLLALVMVLGSLPVTALGAGEDTITFAQISNGMTQLGSRLTFDVFANNTAGEKFSAGQVTARVYLGGVYVPGAIVMNWDDEEKTSYTVTFDETGVYTITIAAGTAFESLTIYYVGTEGLIGYVTASLEVLSLGEGYLIAPVQVPIVEGETAAQLLLRLLEDHGFGWVNTGTVTQAFYIAHVLDNGTGRITSLCQGGSRIPPIILAAMGISSNGQRQPHSLGEFDHAPFSGWMYTVNNVFPNVGFSEYFLADGDVMRVKFTLGMGVDLGSAMMGGPALPVANRDELSRLVSRVGFGNLTATQQAIVINPIALQSDVDALSAELRLLAPPPPPADRAELQAMLAEIRDESDYTAGSWAAFANVLGAVSHVANNPNATQLQVNSATVALMAAIELLEEGGAPPLVIVGDVNSDGEIDSWDLTLMRRYLAGHSVSHLMTREAMDVNGDGEIDSWDLTLMRRYLAEHNVTLGPQN